MPSTVVIVDDEDDLREAVVEYFADRGLRALAARNGAALREIASQGLPDLVVLDVAMPGEDGFALARWLRSFGPRPGIIFATAAGSTAHRIGGLEIGADDYVVKPYELRELAARVLRVLERLPTADATSPTRPRTARFASLILDEARRSVTDPEGRPVGGLSAAEFDLLMAFATRPGRVLTRTFLAQLGNGHDEHEDGGRAVDIRIARLRRKLRDAGVDDAAIRTVRGEGYAYGPET